MMKRKVDRVRSGIPAGLFLALSLGPAQAAIVESIESRALVSATDGPTFSSGEEIENPTLPATFSAVLETSDTVNRFTFSGGAVNSSVTESGAEVKFRVFGDANAGGSPFASGSGAGVALAESFFDARFTLDGAYMFDLVGMIGGSVEGAAHLTLQGAGVDLGQSLEFSMEDVVEAQISENGILEAGIYDLSGFNRASGSYLDGTTSIGSAAFELNLTLAPVMPAAVPVPAALPLLAGAVLWLLACARRRRGYA